MSYIWMSSQGNQICWWRKVIENIFLTLSHDVVFLYFFSFVYSLYKTMSINVVLFSHSQACVCESFITVFLTIN